MIDKVSKQINIRTYSGLKQNWIILFNFSNFCNSLQVSYFIVITFLANNVMRNLIRGTWSLDMFCKLTQNGNKKIKKTKSSSFLLFDCFLFLKTEVFLFCFVLFLFYLGFLSRTFTNHRTAGEGGGHFFSSSLPLPSTSRVLRH